ncbi:hypothetical protein DIE21_34705 [Burkholderia sp. Bp9140]|nr:hypothetical protein DIE21_34705 [Burkholderia sp. Bp9140]
MRLASQVRQDGAVRTVVVFTLVRQILECVPYFHAFSDACVQVLDMPLGQLLPLAAGPVMVFPLEQTP